MVEATAYGLSKADSVMTVAVKMLKCKSCKLGPKLLYELLSTHSCTVRSVAQNLILTLTLKLHLQTDVNV